MESRDVKVPGNVEVLLEGGSVRVNGPLGTLSEDFSHVLSVRLVKEGDVVRVETLGKSRRKELAAIGTVAAHIRNMITGVTKGYTYKLKIVYAHFPMSVKVQRDRVVIENFTGERRPRFAEVLENVKVSVEGDDVVVKGLSIGDVSQTAANIEQATRVKAKDPRVFLDGIYVYDRSEGM